MFDMLSEAGTLECRVFNAFIEANVKLLTRHGEILIYHDMYRRLVGKLNYLIVTRSDIVFAMNVVSQFLSASRTSHWDAIV